MERKVRNSEPEGRAVIIPLLKCLLCAYLLTGLILILLAFVLYRFSLSEKNVSIVIIATYVGATFLAGLLVGKRMKNKRFLWGLIEGCAYFLILVIVSLAANSSPKELTDSFLLTFLLCAGGGTLGGMVS